MLAAKSKAGVMKYVKPDEFDRFLLDRLGSWREKNLFL